ncbi:hypothetical protein [Archangium violaceum]|uniref:hypothetical protein n=1 Tax=Archangium violaceum TaxID=83451 RepID=UPI001269A9CD|nr:hypothetical protein [Archangium violaceum]
MRSELHPNASPDISGCDFREFEVELGGQVIVARSRRGVYQVLAASESEQRAVEQIIASGQLAKLPWDFSPGLDVLLKSTQTPVVGVLPLRVDYAHRALYKILLSFVAYALGPELARLRVFDVFRRAVLEGQIEREYAFELGVERIQRIAQGGERLGFGREAAVFLLLFQQDTPIKAELAAEHVLQPGKHSLVIGCAHGHINALVSFYGMPHASLMCPVPGLDWSPKGIWGCAIVDPRDGASSNDGIGRPSPEGLEHISRYLHELSSRYEGDRAEIGCSLLPSKPQLMKFGFTYEAQASS